MPVHIFTGILTLIVISTVAIGTWMLIADSKIKESNEFMKFVKFLGYSLAI